MPAAAPAPSSPRRLDGPVNALHDRLNARFARLWWPLAPPPRTRPLGLPEHALYVAHVGLGAIAVGLLPLPRRWSVGAIVLLGAGSWVVFTGAWNRRAATYGGVDSADRRSR